MILHEDKKIFHSAIQMTAAALNIQLLLHIVFNPSATQASSQASPALLPQVLSLLFFAFLLIFPPNILRFKRKILPLSKISEENVLSCKFRSII